MQSHKRSSKKHIYNRKRTSKRSKLSEAINLSSNNHSRTTYLSSNDRLPNYSSHTNSINVPHNVTCPRCLTSTRDIKKHYAKNPLCAVHNSSDCTIVTSSKQITMASTQPSSLTSILSPNTNQFIPPSDTNLQFFSTNDIDEELLYIPGDSNPKYTVTNSRNTSQRNIVPKERHETNNPFSCNIYSSFSRNYHLHSFKQILANTKTSNQKQNIDSNTLDGLSTLKSPSNPQNDHLARLLKERNLLHDIEHLQISMSDEMDIQNDSITEEQSPNLLSLHARFDEGNIPVLLYRDSKPPNITTTTTLNDGNSESNKKPSFSNGEHNVSEEANDDIESSSNNSYLDDFRESQKDIAIFHQKFIPSPSFISSVRLLKIMIDGNIAASRYKELVQWHEETLLQFISATNCKVGATMDLPTKKDTTISKCYQILFNNSSKYSIRPVHSLIQLPSRKFCRISSFDFNSMVLSLLSDNELVNPNNMLVEDVLYLNPSFLCSKPDNERFYSDIHTGSWFLNAHNKLCADSPDSVLCPIILFIDGTPIDTYGNLKLESVMFTLGIFNRETRNKSGCWRLLGYIPDATQDNVGDQAIHVADEGDNDEIVSEQVQKRHDYHYTLKHILQGIIDAENSKGILWNYIDSNNNLHTYCLKFALMYVIGDALGNDKLCDRFLSYRSTTKYLCRDCNCPSDKLADLGFHCQFIERNHLKSLPASELKKRSFYKVSNNVFDYCHFGYDQYGINGCTPVEFLHQFLLGVLKKKMEVFFDSITTKGLAVLDNVVKYIAINWHRQSNKTFPDLQPFKDGLMKKKLSGDENIAQVFIVYLAFCQSHCFKAFINAEKNSKPRFKTRKVSDTTSTASTHDTKKHVTHEKIYFKKIGDSASTLKGWISIIEASLAFYAWLKQPKIPYTDLKLGEDTSNPLLSSRNSKADLAISAYLKLYKKVVIGAIGTSSFGMKDHQTLHIPHQVRRFASPINYDGGIGERHLKNVTKNPARLTQQRSSVLAQQATNRYAERLSVTRIHDLLVSRGIINHTSSERAEINKCSIPQCYNASTYAARSLDGEDFYSISGKYTYFVDSQGKFKNVKWTRKTTKKISHKESLVEEVFARLRMDDFQLDCDYLHCFTVLKLNKGGNDITFRADPYFFKKIWFDWCITKWDTESEESTLPEDDGLYPARLLMFIDPSNMIFKKDVISSKGRYWAVIKCTTIDSRRNKSSRFGPQAKLFKTYARESDIRIISCDNIQNDAYICSDLDFVENKQELGKDDYSASHIMSLYPFASWSRIFIESTWI